MVSGLRPPPGFFKSCKVRLSMHDEQLRYAMNEHADVRSFHKKFNQLSGDAPRHLTQRKLQERAAFLGEELQEFVNAAGVQDMAGMADALIDIVYVAIGTADMMGLPWRDLWDDVQRANMAKVRGKTHRNLPHADVCKPPGWMPPRTMEILLRHGYDPTRFGTFTVDDSKCVDDPERLVPPKDYIVIRPEQDGDFAP